MKVLPFLVVVIAALGSHPLAATPDDEAPAITVRHENGIYSVSARFSVTEPAAVVRAVLTDYEQIPNFMPGVRTSRVLERGDGSARVEQEAVSKFLLVSRRVHLVLDVAEDHETIRFRDRCGKSFTRYEGAWTIGTERDRTTVTYDLAARPAFEVPGFVLRRLLDRDARTMIEGLRSQIAARTIAR
jgi:ribosome-associated toxin RatA of RatAB toxin-antitoxin module